MTNRPPEARAPLWRRVRPHLLPMGLYALLTLAITWPAILHLSTHIYGFKGDHNIWMWMAWWRKVSLLEGLPYRFVPLAQAPFGTDQAFRAYPGLLWALTGLSILFNETVAYNLLRLGAYVASGVLTYALGVRLTGNRLASFIGGLVFAFSPYAVEHGMWHVNVAQQWVLPLFLLALANLRERQTPLAAVWLGLAFVVGYYTENYYAYHTVVMALVFAAVEIIADVRERGWQAAWNARRYGLYALAGGLGVALSLPELIPVMREMRAVSTSPLRPANTLLRPAVWHFELSSRPWDFLLPSQSNPILGGLSARAYHAIENIGHLDFAPPFLEERYGLWTRWFWYRARDASTNELYLGYSNLALGAAAVVQWRRLRRRAPASEAARRRRFWVPFLVALFVVALLFSLPPFLPVGAPLRKLWEPLHNIVLPMPSYLTMQIAQPLRIHRRFAAPMLLALALLVAFGLDALLARLRRPAARTALVGVFLAVLAVEFARPPHLERIAPGGEVAWLAQQPAGSTVMTYPFPDPDHVLAQTFHGQPIVDSITIDANFMMDNIHEVQRMAIADLNRPGTVEKLAALEVRYVVNRRDAPTAAAEGLRLVYEGDEAQVYEVVAEPAPLAVLATLQDGLWVSDARWGWQGESFTFTVWNPLNRPVEVSVVVDAGPAGELPPLHAERVMTPHPEQIIWSGITIDNPYIPPGYEDEAVVAAPSAEGLAFSPLRFHYGETTVRLSWGGTLPDGTYPRVRTVDIRPLPLASAQ